MKKFVCMFVALVVFFSGSSLCFAAETGELETRSVNYEVEPSISFKNIGNLDSGVISITVTFDSFDDVKKTGDILFYESDNCSGYLFLQRADRIGNSSRFTVVYTNEQ